MTMMKIQGTNRIFAKMVQCAKTIRGHAGRYITSNRIKSFPVNKAVFDTAEVEHGFLHLLDYGTRRAVVSMFIYTL